eukprot:SAG25_NODE_6140_length_585_cov_0.695473_1_plen_118_part_01
MWHERMQRPHCSAAPRHVPTPLMGRRQPDTRNSVPFPLPVDVATGSARTMVEQHHLSLYKQVNSVASQIDNSAPEVRAQHAWRTLITCLLPRTVTLPCVQSWLLRKKWKKQTRSSGGQ